MAQDVKYVILVTEDALLLGHCKCGKWSYLFATIVANTKILLDIADLVGRFTINDFLICNKHPNIIAKYRKMEKKVL